MYKKHFFWRHRLKIHFIQIILWINTQLFYITWIIQRYITGDDISTKSRVSWEGFFEISIFKNNIQENLKKAILFCRSYFSKWFLIEFYEMLLSPYFSFFKTPMVRNLPKYAQCFKSLLRKFRFLHSANIGTFFL